MSFNKIIVIGNLGRDPELRYTPQGNAVCDFSIATNEKRRDKSGEMQDITTWFRVTTWNKQAENVSKYLSKGKSVYVEGRLRIEEWTDRDGKTRFNLEVNATEIQFLSGGGGESYAGGAAAGGESGSGGENDFDDEPKSSAAPMNQSVPNDDDIPF